MMKKLVIGLCLGALFSATITAYANKAISLETKLTGFQETPAILTKGTGSFKWVLDKHEAAISYTLTFSNLSSPATVAHIHVGQAGVAGAPVAFLCGGGGKPACPKDGGTMTGKIMAADVLNVPAQGIHGGSISDLVWIIRYGVAYVNVHSENHAGGEIRGQVSRF